jgi:hypothetical protein
VPDLAVRESKAGPKPIENASTTTPWLRAA